MQKNSLISNLGFIPNNEMSRLAVFNNTNWSENELALHDLVQIGARIQGAKAGDFVTIPVKTLSDYRGTRLRNEPITNDKGEKEPGAIDRMILNITGRQKYDLPEGEKAYKDVKYYGDALLKNINNKQQAIIIQLLKPISEEYEDDPIFVTKGLSKKAKILYTYIRLNEYKEHWFETVQEFRKLYPGFASALNKNNGKFIDYIVLSGLDELISRGFDYVTIKKKKINQNHEIDELELTVDHEKKIEFLKKEFDYVMNSTIMDELASMDTQALLNEFREKQMKLLGPHMSYISKSLLPAFIVDENHTITAPGKDVIEEQRQNASTMKEKTLHSILAKIEEEKIKTGQITKEDSEKQYSSTALDEKTGENIDVQAYNTLEFENDSSSHAVPNTNNLMSTTFNSLSYEENKAYNEYAKMKVSELLNDKVLMQRLTISQKKALEKTQVGKAIEEKLNREACDGRRLYDIFCTDFTREKRMDYVKTAISFAADYVRNENGINKSFAAYVAKVINNRLKDFLIEPVNIEKKNELNSSSDATDEQPSQAPKGAEEITKKEAAKEEREEKDRYESGWLKTLSLECENEFKNDEIISVNNVLAEYLPDSSDSEKIACLRRIYHEFVMEAKKKKEANTPVKNRFAYFMSMLKDRLHKKKGESDSPASSQYSVTKKKNAFCNFEQRTMTQEEARKEEVIAVLRNHRITFECDFYFSFERYDEFEKCRAECTDPFELWVYDGDYELIRKRIEALRRIEDKERKKAKDYSFEELDNYCKKHGYNANIVNENDKLSKLKMLNEYMDTYIRNSQELIEKEMLNEQDEKKQNKKPLTDREIADILRKEESWKCSRNNKNGYTREQLESYLSSHSHYIHAYGQSHDWSGFSIAELRDEYMNCWEPTPEDIERYRKQNE